MQKCLYSIVATTGLLISTATLAASFAELDMNSDGAIDQGEAAKSSVLAPLFSAADSNTDGNLDQNEFSVLVQSLGISPAQESTTEEAE